MGSTDDSLGPERFVMFFYTVHWRQKKKGFIVRMYSRCGWPWFQASRVIEKKADAKAVFDQFIDTILSREDS